MKKKTVREIVELIRLKGVNIRSQLSKKRFKKESNFLMLDITNAKNRLGWTPRWNTIKTINKTIDWYEKYYSNYNVNQLIDDDINEYIKK